MSDFLAKAALHIRTRISLPPRAKILVAVSGGLDSSVLLHVLTHLAPAHGWELIVAHFNHQLRGSDSDGDAMHAEQLASTWGLPFVSGTPNEPMQGTKGGSLEMRARSARHGFLTLQARQHNCRYIAVGHHAHDQAELLLLRLIRGTGSEGLGGMRWAAPHFLDPALTVIRPLLGCSRTSLQEEAARQNLTVRNDSTNLEPRFLRNRIRLELLPLLGAMNPKSAEHLNHTAELLAAESDFLHATATNWSKAPSGSFSGLHVAVQRECLKQELIRLGVEPDYLKIETLRENPGKILTVSPKLRVVHNGEGKLEQAPRILNRPAWRTDLSVQSLVGKRGRWELSGLSVDWEIHEMVRNASESAQPPPRGEPGFEHFDADMVGPQATLRFWRPGDRFQPLGLPEAAKLQDLFVNARVRVEDRRSRAVLELGNGAIAWVEGLRMGEIAKITTKTKRVLRWRWTRQPTCSET